MTALTKKYNGKDIRIKLFHDDATSNIEKAVNEWLSEIDKEIISIEFSTAHSSGVWKYVLITYKV